MIDLLPLRKTIITMSGLESCFTVILLVNHRLLSVSLCRTVRCTSVSCVQFHTACTGEEETEGGRPQGTTEASTQGTHIDIHSMDIPVDVAAHGGCTCFL